MPLSPGSSPLTLPGPSPLTLELSPGPNPLTLELSPARAPSHWSSLPARGASTCQQDPEERSHSDVRPRQRDETSGTAGSTGGWWAWHWPETGGAPSGQTTRPGRQQTNACMTCTRAGRTSDTSMHDSHEVKLPADESALLSCTVSQEAEQLCTAETGTYCHHFTTHRSHQLSDYGALIIQAHVDTGFY